MLQARPARRRMQAHQRPSQVYYTPNGSATLLNAIKAHNDPGTDYYFTVGGPAAEKTALRPLDAYKSVGLAPNMHPIVEFNLAAWRHAPGSWYEKGVQFRRMMVQAGLPDAMWGINEAGSGVRDRNPAARRHLANLVRGLFRGGGTLAPSQGVIFQQGPGYHQGLQNWQGDHKFWRALKHRVRWYMNETYASPNVFDHWKSPRQSHYLLGATEQIGRFHPLNRLYAPMMSAYWQASHGYGNSQVSPANMQRFIREQKALMRHSGQRVYGFAWNEHPDGVDPANLQVLASLLAAPVA